MDLFKLVGTIAIQNSEANQALDETSQKGQQTQNKLGKALNTVGKGAIAVGKTVGKGLAVGGAAMGALTVKALNLGGELEQNMGGSEQVFGKHAGKMQETAKTAFSNMGLSTSDFLATANKMGALFQGAGFSISESSDLSTKAMQRAADVASIMGIDTSAAMEAIAGAAKGNFTMMDNLGVAMNDTSLQAYALEKGIKKSTQEMTQQEKIGLAMEMFLDKTSYAAGNYARENQTLAGSLGTAKAALTNFLDGSGNVDQLVGAFSNAANVIVDNVTQIAPRLIQGITDIVNQIIPMLPPLLTTLLPVIIEGATSLINGLVQAFPTIITALMAVLPMLIEGFTTIINALIEALPSMIEAIVAALPALIPALVEGLVSMIVTLCASFADIIQPIIDYLPEIIVAIVDALITNAPALITGLIQLVGAIVVAIPEILLALWEGIDTAITGWIGTLVEWATPLVEAISGWWDGVKTNAGEKWEEIKTNVSTKWEEMKTSAGEKFSAIKESISTKWEEMKTNASEKWTSIKADASTKWESIKSTIDEKGSAICDALGLDWETIKSTASSAWQTMKTTISTVINNIKTTISNVWNNIKTIISNVMSGISSALKGDWEGVKSSISNVINAVKNNISTVWNSIKSNVSTVTNGIKTTVSTVFNGIKTVASNTWNNIKTAITKPIETAKTTISGIVDKIKGFFNFKFEWPHIPMPHFGIKPSGWKIGDLLEGSIPSLGIEWYAKGGVMKRPTLFDYDPVSGTARVGGEAGDEAVAPIDTLQQYIRAAVQSETGGMLSILERIVDMLVEFFPDALDAMRTPMVLDPNGAAIAMAPAMNEELGRIAIRKGRGR